jgi:hypothetical protein
MTRLYRLLARAQMHGEVRQPGYVFTLADGERGPHKTVVASNAGGMAWRLNLPPEALAAIPPGYGWAMPEQYEPMMRDEPLFEEIKEGR